MKLHLISCCSFHDSRAALSWYVGKSFEKNDLGLCEVVWWLGLGLKIRPSWGKESSTSSRSVRDYPSRTRNHTTRPRVPGTSTSVSNHGFKIWNNDCLVRRELGCTSVLVPKSPSYS